MRLLVIARTVFLLLALVLPLLAAVPARADDGGGYAVPGQRCQTYTGTYEPGKTVTGFWGDATDGCHRYQWEGSIGQGPGEGTVTFAVTSKVNPWEGGLPSMAGGPAAYCRARAAHEANLQWMFRFRAAEGTEVTVRYRCT